MCVNKVEIDIRLFWEVRVSGGGVGERLEYCVYIF